MVPNWDIHPEMVSHTRVIDTKTGRPYEDCSEAFMENWGWTDGKSVDELADYMSYALRILKNVDLPCEGITTPGGFGNRVLARTGSGDAAVVPRRLRRRDPALLPPSLYRRAEASPLASNTPRDSTAPTRAASSRSSAARATGSAAGTATRPATPTSSSPRAWTPDAWST